MTPFGRRLHATVVEHPYRIAATDHGQRCLTYAELWTAATALSRQIGARPAVRHVLLALRNDVDLVVALAGALLAGVAFVPLELRQSAGYLSSLADNIPDAAFVCTEATRDLATAIGAQEKLYVGGGTEPTGSRRPAGPAAVTEPAGDPSAYVLCTSGSTGRPKGVVVSQRAILAYLDWIAEIAPAARKGSVAHSSIAFDFSLPALLAPLLFGGLVTLVPSEQDLVERLSRPESVGLLRLTPSHVTALHEYFTPQRPMAAGAVVVGGEVLTWSHVHALRRVLPPGTPVWNHYGPTETVVGCVAHRVDTSTDETAAIPIGSPRPGVRATVVDDDLRPLPTGATGELVISGPIADGYLDPDLGRGLFIDHPQWGRSYRTGDLCRTGSDGLLYFTGRRDEQVKIRGHRVELGAVEAVLGSTPGVLGAAAYLEPTGDGRGRLAACLVLSAGADHARVAADAAQVAADRLPDHAQPAVIRYAAALPKTINGKRDVAAMAVLPVVGARAVDQPSASAGTPPDDLRARLCRLFADVLGTPIRPMDNIFSAGGDSVAVLRIVARARSSGISIGIADLFAAPTPDELARRLAPVAAAPTAAPTAAPAGVHHKQDSGEGVRPS